MSHKRSWIAHGFALLGPSAVVGGWDQRACALLVQGRRIVIYSVCVLAHWHGPPLIGRLASAARRVPLRQRYRLEGVFHLLVAVLGRSFATYRLGVLLSVGLAGCAGWRYASPVALPLARHHDLRTHVGIVLNLIVAVEGDVVDRGRAHGARREIASGI